MQTEPDPPYARPASGDTEDADTEVLVVGGSLVGLTSAMLLAFHGVRVILVEPHTGSHPHPRAIGFTERSLEIFRAVGIDGQIPEVPPDHRLLRCTAESLAGKWDEPEAWTPGARGGQAEAAAVAFSPRAGAAIAQDKLEPILRDKARALGAELRLGIELVGFEQDADGVTARVQDRDGRTSEVRARYMIGADGNRSIVRDALGVGRSGPGSLRVMRSVLFRAPLEEYLARGISQFQIQQPGLSAFLTTYGDGRWVLMFGDDEERDEPTLRAAIGRAIGRDDLPVEIITTGRWELTALIADRFSAGRVFLAGDAAHTLPPTRGGFGANTGIHDAQNLAWKLAAVLRGRATPALLDTYDEERRPVAWTRLEQTFARPDYARFAAGHAKDVPLLGDAALELGELVRSRAVLGADGDLPAAARPDVWRGQPGTRAPHLWLGGPATGVSTLDVFRRTWTVLSDDPRWAELARGLAIASVKVAADDAPAFRDAYGIEPGGAVLVRPDGVIAWRTVGLPTNPRDALEAAHRRVAHVP